MKIFMGLCMFLLAGCQTLPTNQKIRTSQSEFLISTSAGSSPTILFQSGLGDGMSTWSGLIKSAPDLSFFAYDRLGYGGSGPLAKDRSPCHQADELHELLGAAHIKPPYLLVGHSLGGLYQYVFALRYPDEVAGLLLLDPTHPNHWKNIQERAKVSAGIINVSKTLLFSSAMKAEFADQDSCLLAYKDSTLQLRISKNSILAVSTQVNPAEAGDYQKLLTDERADWLRLLGISKASPVDGAGHYIHRDKPDVVLKLITHLIDSGSY